MSSASQQSVFRRTSFSEAGYAAITFREARENFGRQHAAADTLDGVDFRYLARNARVNAAAIASLALAPPAPMVADQRGNALIARDPSGYDASLRWTAAPGAVAYRVYWREAWSNDWRHRQFIGDVTLFRLQDVSIDDFVFGVAAVGTYGTEPGTTAEVELVE
jgi:hypothetical protein